MADPDRETMLKQMAANRGCKLVKSRRRKAGTGDYGRYGLKDAATDREVFGFGDDGLTALPEEIEAFLRKGAKADWKSSLAASASAPANDDRTPVSRRRSKAEPEPKPRPKPKLRVVEATPAPPPPPPPTPILEVREAAPRDAPALAVLLGAEDARALARRLSALRKAGEPPLVADQDGEVVGAAAFHAVPLLDEAAPLGRLTLLLVAPAHRRRGVGRALAAEAAARLAALGCARLEAMAEIELAAAPDFFRRLGWDRSAYLYVRTLAGTG